MLYYDVNKMELSEEKQIIELARHSPEAFGELFDFYYPKILGYVIKRTGDIDIAKDIVAETFCKALKNLWQFKWRNISFSAWLYKIATNEINKFFRDKGKYKTNSLDQLLDSGYAKMDISQNILEEIQSAQDEILRHLNFLEAQKALTQIPLKYQAVISLKYFENKKISEISQILGIKEGTIKSLLSRGIKMLREKMQPSDQNSIVQVTAVKKYEYEQR